ncbi:CBS domain-containing protein [Halomarina pelagica]|uniref:CBS domain-containing protein n=1 Tax=Halomarina pelagica TaxID=2961599 RepID=UPI0020C23569|nr:CBS domain-containing protein [Halomarina sp. BND7]
MLRARDLMTTDVETVSPDDEVSEVLSRLAKVDFNGFPVVEGDRLVGIVTQGDLVRLFQTEDRVLWIPIGLPPFTETLTYAVNVSWDDLDLGIDLAKNASRPIREVMTADVVTVEPDDDVDRLLDLLSGEINRLPVVERPGRDPAADRTDAGETGRLVGIVTREDVIRALRDERAGMAEGREQAD